MNIRLGVILMSRLGIVVPCYNEKQALEFTNKELISYLTGEVVAGCTSLILSIWFIGGVQLISIGLIGTYIGKIYMEVKHWPRYNIEINNLAEINNGEQ
jgi:hypothetical protein